MGDASLAYVQRLHLDACSGDQLRVFVKMPSETLGKVNVKPDIPNLYSMRNIHSFVSMPNCRPSPFSGDIIF